MSSKKTKSKTLSEKVADSFTPRSLIDPENNSDDETRAKLAEIDSDDSDYENLTTPKQLSDIRKKNVKLLSEQNDKYKGQISSRKDVLDEEFYENSDSSSADSEAGQVDAEAVEGSESDDDSADGDADDLEKYRKKLKNCQIKDEEKDESFSTDDEADIDNNYDENSDSSGDAAEDSDYGSSGEEVTKSSEEEENLENQNIITETNKSEEIQKGLAVQNQLKIWEKLLEVRIHSQKILIKTNSLPLPEQHDQLLLENEEYVTATKETSDNVQNLLEKMLEMQTILTKQYSETKDLLKLSSSTGKKRPTTSTAELEPATKKFAKILEDNFDNFQPYRNSVLQKWHDRTKILTPGAGAKSKSENFDIIRKIDTVLLNKSDLIEKSQLIKGNYNLFGEKPTEILENDKPDEEDNNMNGKKSCPNIYDDTDFYHQQLRELIEFKTNTSSNPNEISKQFAELQKLRQKMKKKVDTRASKGRKIRYVVHNKLVNFMAPNDQSDWTEESKNELYHSLFTE